LSDDTVASVMTYGPFMPPFTTVSVVCLYLQIWVYCLVPRSYDVTGTYPNH
jgi:hypothetical protein